MLSTEPAKVSTRGGHGDMTAAEISSEASPIDNIRTEDYFISSLQNLLTKSLSSLLYGEKS